MDRPPNDRWIAIDPGRSKCGYAYFDKGLLVKRGIITPEELAAWLQKENFTTVVIGDRTGAESFLRRVYPENLPMGVTVFLVDEDCSSQEGRRRYLTHHRKGWRRFWPITLQSPREPYDDFVAEVLAERFVSDNFEIRSWGGEKRKKNP